MEFNGQAKAAAVQAPTAHGWDATRWQRVLHDIRADLANGALVGAESDLVQAVTSDALNAADAGQGVPEPVAEAIHERAEDAVRLLGRGAFGHLYGDPDATQGGPAWVQALAKAIDGEPALADCRAAVAGDADMTSLAEAALLRQLAPKLPEILERLREAGVDPSEDPGQEGPDGETAIPADELADLLDHAAEGAARAVRIAAQKAVREVSEARSLLNGVLPGLGNPPSAHEQESPARVQLVARLRADARLAKVLEVAGRIRRIAERVRLQRTEDLRTEVVDVERGADLGRVLPSELAGLRHPTMRRVVLKGIADRSLLQYRLSGQERVGRGPIVVLLDISGSMECAEAGMRRIDWASAVGVAAVRAAVEQRRQVTVATFNGAVQQHWTVDHRDPAGCRAAVLAIATIGCDGGTSFDGPVSWALDAGAERDRADLVLVTDGEADRLSPRTQARLDDAKKRGMRLWGVLVGGEASLGTLRQIADGVAKLDGAADAAERVGALGAT